MDRHRRKQEHLKIILENVSMSNKLVHKKSTVDTRIDPKFSFPLIKKRTFGFSFETEEDMINRISRKVRQRSVSLIRHEGLFSRSADAGAAHDSSSVSEILPKLQRIEQASTSQQGYREYMSKLLQRVEEHKMQSRMCKRPVDSEPSSLFQRVSRKQKKKANLKPFKQLIREAHEASTSYTLPALLATRWRTCCDGSRSGRDFCRLLASLSGSEMGVSFLLLIKELVTIACSRQLKIIVLFKDYKN